jgi:hypothetical protein
LDENNLGLRSVRRLNYDRLNSIGFQSLTSADMRDSFDADSEEFVSQDEDDQSTVLDSDSFLAPERSVNDLLQLGSNSVPELLSAAPNLSNSSHDASNEITADSSSVQAAGNTVATKPSLPPAPVEESVAPSTSSPRVA